MKKLLLKYLLPSNWIEALKGNKRLLGVLSLVLWVCIYAIPAVKPEWAFIAGYATQIQEFLASLGIALNNELLVAGATLTVVGAVDWLYDHVISDLLVKVLKAIEGPVSKTPETPEV